MEKGLELLIKEYEHYPSSKSETNIFILYSFAKISTGDRSIAKDVEIKIAELRKGDEDDFKDAVMLGRVIGNLSLITEIENEAIQKIPKGKIALEKKLNEFENIEGLEAKAKEFDRIKSMLSKKQIEDGTLNQTAIKMAEAYGNEGNKKKATECIDLITSEVTKAEVYNTIAWDYSGKGLSGQAKHLEFAGEISKRSLDILTHEKVNRKEQPIYMTATEWNQEIDEIYGYHADTYAPVSYTHLTLPTTPYV